MQGTFFGGTVKIQFKRVNNQIECIADRGNQRRWRELSRLMVDRDSSRVRKIIGENKNKRMLGRRQVVI